jgi:hypothetical protein
MSSKLTRHDCSMACRNIIDTLWIEFLKLVSGSIIHLSQEFLELAGQLMDKRGFVWRPLRICVAMSNASRLLMVFTARRHEFEVIYDQVCRSRTSQQSKVNRC